MFQPRDTPSIKNTGSPSWIGLSPLCPSFPSQVLAHDLLSGKHQVPLEQVPARHESFTRLVPVDLASQHQPLGRWCAQCSTTTQQQMLFKNKQYYYNSSRAPNSLLASDVRH